MKEEPCDNHGVEVKMETNDDEEAERPEGSSSTQRPDETKKQVYLPGKSLEKGEVLVHDPTSYVMFHEAQTGAPCLSFDVIPDGEGNQRTVFPVSAYFVAGTQADRPNGNSIIVMRVSNLHKTQKESESDDDDDSEDEDEEEDKKPVMVTKQIKHHGCINRIRVTPIEDKVFAAVWSEMGKVTVLDLNSQLMALADSASMLTPSVGIGKKGGKLEPMRPAMVFDNEGVEGYGVDWSSVMPGVLATGDCRKDIRIWQPSDNAWIVGQPLIGHSRSVEDLQWSPSEPHVLASCSVDKSIKIWDTREGHKSACKLTVEKAHESDINVISWNKKEPLIVSGGDDHAIKVWDLRNFKTDNVVAKLDHHKSSITSVEWCPTESSVIATSGEDDQIALWDLAVEPDDKALTSADIDPELANLPPQLLFIHQGQTDIKELHWHPQIPGMVISTAGTGFNFFKTISV